MKKKKIKKISKKIFKHMSDLKKPLPKKKPIFTDKISEAMDGGGYWCDYDINVSNKFKKLVLNLLNYPNNLNIEIHPNTIYLRTDDVKLIKSPRTKGNSLRKSSEDGYLRIEIFKEKGFSINYGYDRMSRYKDTSLYDEIQPLVDQALKDLNVNNFVSIWEDISIDSGIIRDSNLDEILN